MSGEGVLINRGLSDLLWADQIRSEGGGARLAGRSSGSRGGAMAGVRWSSPAFVKSAI